MKTHLTHRLAAPALLATAAAAAALPGTAAIAAQPLKPLYRLESAVPLKSSAPDWDYVSFEPARSYLYIGRRADGVTVYDVKAHKLVRTIAGSQDANATALVPEFDRGYTVNGDGSSTVFKLSTLQTLGRITIGKDADNAFYEPVTKQLAFMSGDSQEIAFVDAKTGQVNGRLKTESHKLDGSVADGTGQLFVAQRDRNALLRVDARQQQVTAEWPTTGCEQPTGLALDAESHRLFVGCRGKNPVLAVMDADTGRVVTTLPIGRGNDGVIHDPQAHKVYTSNGVDGNLVIFDQVDADHYKLAEAATTRPYARTMALDPKTKKVFMVTAEGTLDPAREANSGPSPFYPNRYFAGTFTLLTFAPK